MVRLRRHGLIVTVLMLLARTAWADAAGTVAVLEGTVEVGRIGAWEAARIGMPVNIGDEVRTREEGRVRVVFQDSSVLNVGPETTVSVDKHSLDPAKGIFTTLLRLGRGKVRALVGADHERPRTLYEIETPTAISAVRGTEFVIAYDPVADVTDVVGVAGQVAVNSTLDRTRRGVIVGTQHLTKVARGKLPTAPVRVDEKLFRQYLEDLEFIGSGRSESMILADPLITGSAVPSADSAAALPALKVAVPEAPVKIPDADVGLGQDAASLLQQPPASVQDAGQLGIEF
jgi:hypothetical protein